MLAIAVGCVCWRERYECFSFCHSNKDVYVILWVWKGGDISENEGIEQSSLKEQHLNTHTLLPTNTSIHLTRESPIITPSTRQSGCCWWEYEWASRNSPPIPSPRSQSPLPSPSGWILRGSLPTHSPTLLIRLRTPIHKELAITDKVLHWLNDIRFDGHSSCLYSHELFVCVETVIPTLMDPKTTPLIILSQTSWHIRAHFQFGYLSSVLSYQPSYQSNTTTHALFIPSWHDSISYLYHHPHSPPNSLLFLSSPLSPRLHPIFPITRFPIIICKHNPHLLLQLAVSFLQLSSLNRFDTSTLFL